MISLAITTWERTNMVLESFAYIINNNLVDDIVIVDDCSNHAVFELLATRLQPLGDKIRLFRNEVNLKPYRNKYEAVKRCKNEWVVLFDSDNIIDNDYIATVDGISKEADIIYCPSYLYRTDEFRDTLINFEKWQGFPIDKDNIKEYLGTWNFETFLNTCNYCVNRSEYLKVWEKDEIDPILSKADTCYFSFLWLMSGRRMILTPNLRYVHRVHEHSWYLGNVSDYDTAIAQMLNLLKETQ